MTGAAVVVGAGVSGAFAADTLRARLGPATPITVLEREPRTGGRAYRRTVSGVDVETGASLFHSSNRLVAGAAAQLGLTAVPATGGRGLGIWDGSRLVLRTRGGRTDSMHLLARYRGALVRAGREVAAFVRRLEQVYPALERGSSWQTAEELWQSLGLAGLTRVPSAERLRPDRFVTELVDGVSRNNYAQEASGLSALVGLVSLAGAGLGGGSLHRVAEGYAAVSAGLLRRSGADLRTSCAVRRIERSGAGWRVTGEGLAPLDADVVVLAAPLEGSGIELPGVPLPPPRTFVTVHVTFVAGSLAAGAFGDARPAPGTVLTTATAGSLLSVERVSDTGPLYKVFSTTELTDDDVTRLFRPVEVTRMSWQAYPRLPAGAPLPAFRLAPGLYSTGALEYSVSTMETQAVSGVASANLAAREHG